MLDETKIGRIASDVIDVIWAGILFLLCSVPVITIGASSCALYYALVKSVRHERGNLTREFFHAFKVNLKAATLLWLACLAVIVPCIISVKLIPYYALPVLVMLPWLFPYVSRFTEPFLSYVKNVFLISIKNIGRTLLTDAVIAAGAAAAYLLPALIPLLPGFVCLLISYGLEPKFKEITLKMVNENEDCWYNE